MFSWAGFFLLLLASHQGWPACETPYKSHSLEYLLVRYVALGQHARTNGNIQRLWCKRRFPVKQDKQVINCITLGLAIYGWSIVILLSCFCLSGARVHTCLYTNLVVSGRWLAYVIFFLENISRKAQRSVKPIQFSFLRLNNEKSGKFYNNWANRGVGTFSF